MSLVLAAAARNISSAVVRHNIQLWDFYKSRVVSCPPKLFLVDIALLWIIMRE